MDLDPANPYARESCGFFVTSHRQHITAKGCEIEQNDGQANKRSKVEHGIGDTEGEAISELNELRVNAINGKAASVHKGQPTPDVHHRESHDQGGNASQTDAEAVSESGGGPDPQSDNNQCQNAEALEGRNEDYDQPNDRPNRKIDAGRDDHEGHAQGNDARNGDLPQHVQNIRGSQKHR